ncbi:SIMPL domain-containing protein [Candidatus Kuenenbacteria bacterium]|nr:SIMPL domain-containing protein [Candidatus Kuenenbacteria bacterium]
MEISNQDHSHKTMWWYKVLVVLCVTAIVIVSVVLALRRNDFNNQFSVSATGRVFAKPDIANLTVGLKTEAKQTAALAVKENTTKMNEIIKVLKDLAIEEKDIKTTNYSLNPVYDWTEKSGQTLRGYEVYQNVEIKIRDLDKIGDAIAKTAEKGANQVGNVSFTIDDEFELRNQAREEAIKKAKEKAESIVGATGIKLGKIINVYESQVYNQPYVNYSKDMAYGLGGGGAMSIPAPEIQTGQNEVVVEATVVWEVK